ncbi:hypothetical protein PCYB_011800 [Plasmodium cynomolgi strain B]|uniref:Uncharacterized protein n=1 Tax=Plasmodium cynomolgi (strain B) TaxID=1120755 RepID=K6V5Q8_PLACD|nr:hypothetical protein PCYB_011800 [Plasmodium cynomolgi strain B]GAB64447.1 hypothetical protein PCYB_011800 [Plasmodium cynomolgi strain B]
MIAFDELFEFLREAEITCDHFNEQIEEQETIILFLNELKSCINDLSLSLKHRINTPDDITEQDILKKVINKKESLEWILRKKRDNVLGGTNHGDVSSSANRTNCDAHGNSDVDYPTGETPPSVAAQPNNADATTYAKGPTSPSPSRNSVSATWDTYSKVNVAEKHPTPSHSLPPCATRGYNKVEPSLNGEKVPAEHESLSREDPPAAANAAESVADQSERKSCDVVETLSDEVLKEWSEQIDEYDNLLYEYSFAFKKKDLHKKIQSRKNMNKSGENIDEELCLLAQEMKENVLTYRDIIVEDNRMLEQSANKQMSNLDNITDVYKKTKKMGQSKNISFFVSLLIIAVSALLFVLTFFVILTL